MLWEGTSLWWLLTAPLPIQFTVRVEASVSLRSILNIAEFGTKNLARLHLPFQALHHPHADQRLVAYPLAAGDVSKLVDGIGVDA